MPLLTIHHVTTYRYKQAVSVGEHHIMMRPREAFDQHLLSVRLEITPELRWLHDGFGIRGLARCVQALEVSGTSCRLPASFGGMDLSVDVHRVDPKQHPLSVYGAINCRLADTTGK